PSTAVANGTGRVSFMSRGVLGAGGTGGHIFPAIAVAEELRRRNTDTEILFIGLGNEIEQRLLTRAGFRHEPIRFVPITGAGVKGLIRFFFALPGAWLKGIRLYRKLRPSAVMGFGGYPAFIPVLSAWALGVPSALHEQ